MHLLIGLIIIWLIWCWIKSVLYKTFYAHEIRAQQQATQQYYLREYEKKQLSDELDLRIKKEYLEALRRANKKKPPGPFEPLDSR